MKWIIVDPTGNIVDPHVCHLSELQVLPSPQIPLAPQAQPATQALQASQAPTGLAVQPLTAAPNLTQMPTAATKTSWREWFATGDQRVSDRSALRCLRGLRLGLSLLLITVMVCSVFF